MNWAAMVFAVLIGMENPRPRLVPLMSALIPMTLPSMSQSGPPLLPGLIDASVWRNQPLGKAGHRRGGRTGGLDDDNAGRRLFENVGEGVVELPQGARRSRRGLRFQPAQSQKKSDDKQNSLHARKFIPPPAVFKCRTHEKNRAA